MKKPGRWTKAWILAACLVCLGPIGIILYFPIIAWMQKNAEESENKSPTSKKDDLNPNEPVNLVENKQPEPPKEPLDSEENMPSSACITKSQNETVPVEQKLPCTSETTNEDKDKNTHVVTTSLAVLIVIVGIAGLTVMYYQSNEKASSPYRTISSKPPLLTNNEDSTKPAFTHEEYKQIRNENEKTKEYNREAKSYLDSKFGSGFSDSVKKEGVSTSSSVKDELNQVIKTYDRTTHRFLNPTAKERGAELIAKIQFQSEALSSILPGTPEENAKSLISLGEQAAKQYEQKFSDREVFFFCCSFSLVDANGKVSLKNITEEEKLYMINSKTSETMQKMQEIMSEVFQKKPAVEYPK